MKASDSGVMAVAASVIAICWNLSFNHLFEKWGSEPDCQGRSVLRRVVHAIGFEGGLALVLIPLMAWWFTLRCGSCCDGSRPAGVLYGLHLVFNWAFDRLFGLPASAQALTQ